MNFEKDKPLTIFSSEGKIKQCDYALVATLKGSLSVGAKSCDGVVLASIKDVSPLIDKTKVFKIQKVCDTIGITYSGLQPDFRIIFFEAVKLVENYKDVYGHYPYLDVFVIKFSQIIQEYTQKGGFRPFGVMLLICGPMYMKDKIVPAMYQIDPSGSFISVKSSAIGKDYTQSARYIENRLGSLSDNVVVCLNSIRENYAQQITENDIDVGVFDLNKFEFRILDLEKKKEIIDSIKIK